MGNRPTPPEVSDRRRARLRDELVDAGLRMPSGPRGELLLDELAYARWAGVHERRRFGYGCVLDPRDVAAVGEPLAPMSVPVDEADLSELRRYADGRRVLLVRGTELAPQLVTVRVPDEFGLVRLQRCTGGTVVRRIDGGVQVVSEDGSVGDHIGHWALRPSLTDAVEALGDLVPLELRDVLGQLLDLCLHVLSPRRVGATFVWRLEEPRVDMLRRPPMAGPLELSVVNDLHLGAVAKRVSLLDGACVVARDGAVEGFGAFLGWSDETEERVTHETGLRHSSARWYSHDIPEALLLVVSEDGPLTVYHGGREVLSTSSPHPAEGCLRLERTSW